VLCELVYRWFCPANGSILDPFAGGSVRGIVAAKLGYQYVGVDLSERQIEANRAQAKQICDEVAPAWVVGDARDAKTLAKGEYDLIFSCPPYFDLEVYSDNPQDLSTLDYDTFKKDYCQIIADCVAMLKDNRFACFVVGDIRDKKGFYRNLPSLTIDAFQSAGATLYNEAILVTAVGSLPIRVGKQFGSYRKLGKTHQNVLVFFKGNPQKIKEDFTEIEVEEATGVRTIKISAKWAKHKFNCTKDYILSTCHGSCCQGSDRILISLLPNEAELQLARGFNVIDGLLQPDPMTGKCPHKLSNGFCGVHGTELKPFGCIASPFTLNDNDTLIIRNRYSKMRCFGSGEPAYKTFRASLDLILGQEESERVCQLLETTNSDVKATISESVYQAIRYLDGLKK